MKSLQGKVALVAGATRGAGRGIACMLGEAGAIVYCSGRSARGSPATTGPYAGRPETIEETAEMVTAHGGTGIPIRTDHANEEQVAALFKRVRREQGRLDVLVNVFWGGPSVSQWGKFWKHSLEEGHALYAAAWPHVITCRHAAALMVEHRTGLIVQITEGDALFYRQNLFYDLGRISEIRLAYALAEELTPHGVTALALTPGYLRSEAMLDHFGVTEANWREGAKKDPTFIASETPFFVGRAVAALAADPRVLEKSGGAYSSWGLAREYGFTDIDGSRPDLGKYSNEHLGEYPLGPPRTGFRWTLSRLTDTEQTRRRRSAPRRRKSKSESSTRSGGDKTRERSR
jgi:NAD(P)-dependent dehydrogenase (short-subunit alcohol dehydrogenase family)